MGTSRITIKQVADILSISQATVRNWLKAGKINKIETYAGKGKVLFDELEILQLKQQIESGKDGRLQSRRNKWAIKGNIVDSSYVNYKPYLSIAEDVIEIAKTMQHLQKHRLILLELSLLLLVQRGHIDTVNQSMHLGENHAVSMTEAVVKQMITLGHYEDALKCLFNYRAEGMDISMFDLDLLAKLNKLQITYVVGEDFLGLIYMSLRQLGERKEAGSYYTSAEIVDMLINQTLAKLSKDEYDFSQLKIVDPCCGSGNFLIRTFLHIREKYGVDEHLLIKNIIYGYEIDPIAAALAAVNLLLVMDSKLEFAIQPQITCSNTLLVTQKFDIIIGNPPWGYRFNDVEMSSLREQYLSARSSVESFSMFIEWGYNHLLPNGYLSYVLPEAVLNVKSHYAIRKIILENTTIDSVTYLGNRFCKVYTPAIILTFRKNKPEMDSWQRQFLDNEHYVINARADKFALAILKQMRELPNAKFLAGNADFALGIVTGNNKQHILSECPIGGEAVLKGRNVFKYNYYKEDNYIVFQPDKYQQVAPAKYYRAKEKLIYRFINDNILFAYDDRQILTLNSANIVIPRLEGYAIKFVLAVLNSRAIQFFYNKSYASVKVLRKHIEAIPLPYCAEDKQARIIMLVDRLIDSQDLSERSNLYDQIDVIIMELFKLSKEQKDYIIDNVDTEKYLGVL